MRIYSFSYIFAFGCHYYQLQCRLLLSHVIIPVLSKFSNHKCQKPVITRIQLTKALAKIVVPYLFSQVMVCYLNFHIKQSSLTNPPPDMKLRPLGKALSLKVYIVRKLLHSSGSLFSSHLKWPSSHSSCTSHHSCWADRLVMLSDSRENFRSTNPFSLSVECDENETVSAISNRQMKCNSGNKFLYQIYSI